VSQQRQIYLIFMDEMLTKFLQFWIFYKKTFLGKFPRNLLTSPGQKNSGFSLLELIVAITISAIVLTSSFSIVISISKQQKQGSIRQDFIVETQFLMERMVNLIRNNTIDYDRYFQEIGPDTTKCSSFSAKQVDDKMLARNNEGNHKKLIYKDIFFWDTTGNGKKDRYLGGLNLDGDRDKCAAAFHGNLDKLYLINSQLNKRYGFRVEGSRLQLSIQLGSDFSGNGKIDNWGPTENFATTGDTKIHWEDAATGSPGKCKLSQKDSTTSEKIVFPITTSKKTCKSVQKWTNISPSGIEIDKLNFFITPDRDPFLAFRDNHDNSKSQSHPLVVVKIKTKLKDWEKYLFNDAPSLNLQTSASSRVFGDVRGS